MYSKEKAKKPIYTLDWILSKVTEYDIYASYLGEFKVGLIYNSPFREDKNPSFGIYYSKRTQQLLFKDHGTGQCGNVIKFVSLITGKTNYDDILEDIVNNRQTLTSTVILKLDAGSTLKLFGTSIEDINYQRARIDIEKIY